MDRLRAAREQAMGRLLGADGTDGAAWLILEQRWRDLERRLASLAEQGEVGAGLRELVTALGGDLAGAYERFRARG